MSVQRSLLKDVNIILFRARELVKKGWTCKTTARDDMGHGVDVNSRHAVKFCAAGAIRRAYLDQALERPMEIKHLALCFAEARQHFRQCTGTSDPLSTWNDAKGRTQEEVLEVFAKALGEKAETPDASNSAVV